MTPIEKARAALKQEQSRKEEFYEGAAYALKLVEATQVGESETPKTNGDRVRAMSDDELTALLRKDCNEMCIYGNSASCSIAKCNDGILAWMRREAER